MKDPLKATSLRQAFATAMISPRTSASFFRYAAMALAAIMGAGVPKSAQAQTMPASTTVRLKYVDYKDFQGRAAHSSTRFPAPRRCISIR